MSLGTKQIKRGIFKGFNSFIFFFKSLALLLAGTTTSKQNSSFTENYYSDVSRSHTQFITKGWRKTNHRNCLLNHFNRWKLCRLKCRSHLITVGFYNVQYIHGCNVGFGVINFQWVSECDELACPVQTIRTTRNMFVLIFRTSHHYNLMT